ncbi:Pentatricopeptide repeat-containing protein [Camellia lanceoleosa]|uniref:Pentatricopeptide repeat-containing protein n=1 Tax=Camellia lanceoleosa TaxID=1840588 RepID=A0ACC0HRW9_9ERIC|nr:Pentatricopeptide repeat-containing protein [Camellia lanceoleosa]
MASLPSVLVANTLKLEPDLCKLPSSLPIEKRSYSTNTQLGKALDPTSLDFREALSLIREGTSVESSIYVPLLQECIERNSVAEAQVIHGHICGAMENARKVFDYLPKRNVVTWTSLMTGYVRNSQPELAFWVFIEMLEVGAYPTNYTLGVVLNASCLMYAIGLGKQIHSYIVKYDIEYDTSVGNALCSLYSDYGSLNSAVKAFLRIREKNVISWTTVISSCGDNGDSGMGLSLFREMLSEGVEPNEFTLTSILSSCCVMHALSVGSQVHSLTIKLGYELNLPVTNSIMYLYLKCGHV